MDCVILSLLSSTWVISPEGIIRPVVFRHWHGLLDIYDWNLQFLNINQPMVILPLVHMTLTYFDYTALGLLCY